ncbi:MAG TPA: biopolymer transporter ExbD [Elusimicrobiota bacterium]|nr:biopolymer transporter ExbD [Elusimicrobiota bacterium]
MDDPSQSGEVEETEKINVVPLADLTLVLLIILMVLSPMITQSMINVATPAVKAEKDIEQKPQEEKKPVEPLLIALAESGYTLNNVPADSLDQLMAALRARLEETPDRPVLVTADQQITVGAVVEVLDLAKQNGAQKVSLLKRAGVEESAEKTAP